MKILTGIDVPFRPFGGSLLSCNDWYSDLPDDIEVRFLALQPPSKERWWSIKDVVLFDVPQAKTVAEFSEHVAQLKELVKQEIADFRPDIIHCQHLNYGLSRAFVDIAADIPKLGICHGTDVQAAVSYSFFHDNLVHICDRLDEITFPNQNMATDFFAVYPRDKQYVISPHGIPDRYFQMNPDRTPFDSRRKMEVVYAGRLLAWKGADIAVKAMTYIHEAMHLTVIGNEDQPGYVDSMREFIREHRLEELVTFIPQLPRDELVASFSKYDVMVLPSRRLEAFSLTVVEAQAMGLPIVFADGGGIVNTAGNGGLMLRENTPEGLAAALDTLYRKPDTLTELQQKGRINAQQYTLSQVRKQLFDVSAELITQRAGRTLPRF